MEAALTGTQSAFGTKRKLIGRRVTGFGCRLAPGGLPHDSATRQSLVKYHAPHFFLAFSRAALDVGKKALWKHGDSEFAAFRMSPRK